MHTLLSTEGMGVVYSITEIPLGTHIKLAHQALDRLLQYLGEFWAKASAGERGVEAYIKERAKVSTLHFDAMRGLVMQFVEHFEKSGIEKTQSAFSDFAEEIKHVRNNWRHAFTLEQESGNTLFDFVMNLRHIHQNLRSLCEGLALASTGEPDAPVQTPAGSALSLSAAPFVPSSQTSSLSPSAPSFVLSLQRRTVTPVTPPRPAPPVVFPPPQPVPPYGGQFFPRHPSLPPVAPAMAGQSLPPQSSSANPWGASYEGYNGR